MKRTFSTLFILAVVIVGTGVFLRQQRSLGALTRTAEERAEEVALAYVSLVDTQVRPLLAQNILPSQHPAVPALTTLGTALRQPTTLQSRLQYISQLQLALWDLVNSAAHAPDAATNDLIVALKKNIGNRGAFSTQIEAYNSAAMRWNRAQEGPWLSLRARLSEEELPRLPFLRFDGQQEFIPIIQL